MKYIVIPAGDWGIRTATYLEQVKSETVKAFLDNDKRKQGAVLEIAEHNIKVIDPNKINREDYDRIIIATVFRDIETLLKEQLLDNGVEKNKIITLHEDQGLYFEIFSETNEYDEQTDERVTWLRHYSEFINEKGIEGNTAECGVYRGDFSFYIKKYFSGRKHYLIDTFRGFDQKDIEAEKNLKQKGFEDGLFAKDDGQFAMNSIDFVKAKMGNKWDECIPIQGFFPESVEEHPINDKFCFVNLDMDLYQPMLAGLRYFYPMMVSGGVILIHDYYYEDLPGVKAAVKEFSDEEPQAVIIPVEHAGGVVVVKR